MKGASFRKMFQGFLYQKFIDIKFFLKFNIR